MLVYIIIGTVLLLLLIYFLVTYNSLVSARNIVKEAFSTMDVYLKKRWDLIPNLVESVKGYTTHEVETLESIVSLRNGAYDDMNSSKKIEVNTKLEKGISSIVALKESYPDLKANTNFLDLMKSLTLVEDEIANSRKYYNGAVRKLNNKVLMFPSSIVAGIFGIKEEKMFEAAENEKESVKVNL